MRYASFRTGPWPKKAFWQETLYRALTHVIPKANPDIEKAYEQVSHWWLEMDDDGLVQREIAFDDAGRIVALGPLGRNLGMFTDIDGAPETDETVDAHEFGEAWAEGMKLFERLALK